MDIPLVGETPARRPQTPLRAAHFFRFRFHHEAQGGPGLPGPRRSSVHPGSPAPRSRRPPRARSTAPYFHLLKSEAQVPHLRKEKAFKYS